MEGLSASAIGRAQPTRKEAMGSTTRTPSLNETADRCEGLADEIASLTICLHEKLVGPSPSSDKNEDPSERVQSATARLSHSCYTLESAVKVLHDLRDQL